MPKEYKDYLDRVPGKMVKRKSLATDPREFKEAEYIVEPKYRFLYQFLRSGGMSPETSKRYIEEQEKNQAVIASDIRLDVIKGKQR